ncbi:EamA family transporter RarD [Nocardioides alkalitolerans]|uniref:EamA family transporter RarD n=1 Tax=Nocardioides alkalitolerans TaxID=281714 RepID=UPI000425A050|nr:EamA family transporter RarD [Nocardioides alkalitolerans]
MTTSETTRPTAASAVGPGVAMGFAAYLLWGVFPLYFPLLEPAGPLEILAQRMLWSAVTMGLLVVVLRRTAAVRALLSRPRTMGLLALAALTISINWGMFIYGVSSGHVLETSLGYFINPLVTVLMGVLLLGERLRPLQWAAIGVAGVAVVVLTVDYGRLPWVALVLAFSFGTYGLVKKTADVGAVESLAIETAFVLPFATAYVVFLGVTGGAVFGSQGPGHAAIFAASGIITAIPLLLFGGAATRVPMVVLGLLQYLAPLCQFALGILWFGEEMPASRWIGFTLVWLALAIFTVEMVRHRRHLRVAATAATAT